MSLKERVRELGARVKHNQKFLDQEREEKKRRAALEKEMADAPEEAHLDFFCRECDRDVVAWGHKCVYSDGMGLYVSQCPNGHRVTRYITQKWRDPYWELSRKVRMDREKYADDMLSPLDPRFKIVYPAQWKAIQEQQEMVREKYERKSKETKS